MASRGHVQLGPARAPREILDGVPVGVARGEVHGGVTRAGPQHPVHEADGLEELRPVQRGHQAHAQDHVADGHVHRRLPLVLDAHDVVGGRALRLQPLVEPEQGRRDRAVLLAQPLDELHREGRHQRAALEPGQAPGGRQRGAVVADSQQLVGQRVGLLARRPPAHDALGQAAEVLDEHDAKGDGHRPQLADGQRLHALVGLHEPPEHLRVEPAVGVGHEGPGQAVHARVAGQRPLGQLGQLAVEPGREVVADLAQLLVDDVKVVDQPFRRRRDRALLADGGGDDAVRLAEHATVVLDARQQAPPPARPVRDGLGRRQALGVLLESLDAEELGTDRALARRRRDQRVPRIDRGENVLRGPPG